MISRARAAIAETRGGMQASIPALTNLHAGKLTRLRSENLAELTKDLMMTALSMLPWYSSYKASLNRYREGAGVAPDFPAERVESLVDQVIRVAVDADYRTLYFLRVA